jgi:hypothetical protein
MKRIIKNKMKNTNIIGLAERKSDRKILPVICIVGKEICTLETFLYESSGLKVHRQWHPRNRYGKILTIPVQKNLATPPQWWK